MGPLQEIFTEYYESIDAKSKELAHSASENQKISANAIKFINEIYQSVKTENKSDGDHFDSAYHLTITPFVEFFIARIFYHYSEYNDLKWYIKLRRQEKKTVPDIRIYQKVNAKERTIALIEIKTRVSWMQACFSEYRSKKDEKYRQEKGSDVNSIKKFQEQIQKYLDTYHITEEQFFVFIPTLSGAYKPTIEADIEKYKMWFYRMMNLKEENLILLSNNPRLNLDKDNIGDLQATQNLELLLKSLAINSKKR